jgi:hypothetical protein
MYFLPFSMAYRVLSNVGYGQVHVCDTFAEAYDVCAGDDVFTAISFDGMEWVYKTKGDIWESEDCLENLNEEYKNEEDLENGYWVWFASVAPNHNDIVNMEACGLITSKERNAMYFRACVMEVLNEQTFMNRFGYFNE